MNSYSKIANNTSIKKILDLEDLGDIEKTLVEINKTNLDDQVQIIKCRLLMCSGKHEESVNISKNLVSKANISNDKLIALELRDYEIICYLFDNELEIAQNLIQESDLIFENLNENDKKSSHLGNMWYNYAKGVYNEKIGNLDLAEIYIIKSGSIIKNHKFAYYESVILGTLGRIYDNKGELEKAITFYQEEFDLAQKTNEIHRMGRSKQNLARINWKKGELGIAYNLYNESLDLFNKSDNKSYLPETLEHLVRISSELNLETSLYLDQLESLSKISEDKDAIIRYKLAKAFILKSSKRLSSQSKAQEIFRDITENENTNHECIMFSILNMLDMLFNEMKVYGEEEILTDINYFLEKLDYIVAKQNSSQFLAESLLLKSKLALIKNEFNLAKSSLLKAEKIAIEKGLKYLVIQIAKEYDKLLDEESMWKPDLNNKSNIKERITNSNTNQIVDQLLSKREQLIEVSQEEPVLLMILKNSGISVYSKSFIPENNINDQLLGGFMTAINSLSQEILTSKVDRIRSGDFTILMEEQENFQYSYIYKGNSDVAYQKLNRFTNKLKNSKFWNTLQTSIQTGRVFSSSEGKEIDSYVSEIFVK